MKRTTPKASRSSVLKTVLHADEASNIHRECALAGVTRSSKARALLISWATHQRNSRRYRQASEGPSYGNNRALLFPGTQSYGIKPRAHYRV